MIHRRYRRLLVVGYLSFVFMPQAGRAQDAAPAGLAPVEADTDEIVVSATRLPVPEDEAPASVSVITADDLEQKQTRRVADALREVPGLSVVQTGTPGQLTSVFVRGLGSDHTQVLLDGIPVNQGLAGLFNFADLTTDNIDRIEVVRGPQSTLYGPRALAGVIQIFTRQGSGTPVTEFSAEGGSYNTARETLMSEGGVNGFDYSIGASRVDTNNARPNNEYRNTDFVGDFGYSPDQKLRLAVLTTYSLSDTGDPNSILTPKPYDHLLTERWLIAPHIDYKPFDWWAHRLIVSYDHERQVNDPNDDGFTGPTRALFQRLTLDYQNNLRPVSWLTVTSGLFYSDVASEELRPFVSQAYGPSPTQIGEHTDERAVFLELSTTPIKNLNIVLGGRYDNFNQFGDVYTYRIAGSYKIERTDTTFHTSLATGFAPPSSQDIIFGNNPNLDPEKDKGWEVGAEQRLWKDRFGISTTFFHNDLSNVIGYDGNFNTVNLGAARTQGVEVGLHATPIKDLEFTASYTYLDAVKTSAADISQPQGARLPRRPRNEAYVSASYLWFGKLRTVAEAKFVNAREELNFGGPNFDIEDYSFVNLRGEYEVNPHLTIFARVDNLTNEHYAEVYGYPALGRAAYGGFRVRF